MSQNLAISGKLLNALLISMDPDNPPYMAADQIILEKEKKKKKEKEKEAEFSYINEESPEMLKNI